ncbi:MAG: hypothetical protein JST54_03725 [Deltaproteobacteria bacterium]|nr:hypothetical protein [Deltaproteobacteria bacterium]
MSATPNPIEYRTRHAEPCPDRYRNLTCFSYGSCLDLAVKRGWGDWSCQACPMYNAVRPIDLASFAHDRRRHDG